MLWKNMGITPIDLVVVVTLPIQGDYSLNQMQPYADAVENIDIGGPSMRCAQQLSMPVWRLWLTLLTLIIDELSANGETTYETR